MNLIGWLAIYSSLRCIFSGALICSFIWAIFGEGVSAHLLCIRGLRYLPGRSNPLGCIVMLYVREGSEREQCGLLRFLLVFSHFPSYPQSNWAFLVLVRGGWVCSRTLCLSPTNFPVRLGVSPTAASTPTGVFSQRL